VTDTEGSEGKGDRDGLEGGKEWDRDEEQTGQYKFEAWVVKMGIWLEGGSDDKASGGMLRKADLLGAGITEGCSDPECVSVNPRSKLVPGLKDLKRAVFDPTE